MKLKLSYMKLDALEQLKKDAHKVVDEYKSEEVWIDGYFENLSYYLPSYMLVDKVNLKKPDENSNYDVENTIALYSAMEDIKVVQASDERLWAFMCHKEYWDYMKSRWPIEGNNGEVEEGERVTKKNPKDRIIERYFFQSNRGRALVRNGIARLWWYGYMTYDESREDPFELTKILLRRHDDAQSLLERSFPHNKAVLHAILSALSRHEYVSRENFRSLMKSMNRIGGVTILDTLDKKDLLSMVEKKLSEIMKLSESKKASKTVS
jgi:uncharacterized protein YlaN (UPF0358 family)